MTDSHSDPEGQFGPSDMLLNPRVRDRARSAISPVVPRQRTQAAFCLATDCRAGLDEWPVFVDGVTVLTPTLSASRHMENLLL